MKPHARFFGKRTTNWAVLLHRASIISLLVLGITTCTANAQTAASQVQNTNAGTGSAPEERGAMSDNQIFTHVIFDQFEGRPMEVIADCAGMARLGWERT